MNTILVPTDFSENARNASAYALRLAADVNTKKVVFFNAYQAPPVLTEPTMPAMPVMDIETMREISNSGMEQFKRSLEAECPSGVEIEHITEFSILSNDITEICNRVGAELIVMGITGTSKIEEVLIGSTATSVIKHTKVPVIVVPAEASYSGIRNVMLACDFKKVAETTPVQPIESILDATRASLHVLNVYESDKEITSEKTVQKELLHSLLRAYNPQFHFKSSENFIQAINEFSDDNAIDLVITIPRKHGFFESLFREGHSKKLAFHSHVPLMFVHQEDL